MITTGYCVLCKYCVKESVGRTCRRHPPSRMSKFEYSDDEFPRVRKEDWCGEFEWSTCLAGEFVEAILVNEFQINSGLKKPESARVHGNNIDGVLVVYGGNGKHVAYDSNEWKLAKDEIKETGEKMIMSDEEKHLNQVLGVKSVRTENLPDEVLDEISRPLSESEYKAGGSSNYTGGYGGSNESDFPQAIDERKELFGIEDEIELVGMGSPRITERDYDKRAALKNNDEEMTEEESVEDTNKKIDEIVKKIGDAVVVSDEALEDLGSIIEEVVDESEKKTAAKNLKSNDLLGED